LKKAEYLLVVITILSVVGYALYNYMNKSSKKAKVVTNTTKKPEKIYHNTQEDVVAYIENVIINGSNKLKVSKEVMEGGYIPKEKAKDVACYVYELSGRKCTKKYAKDAAMYFSSSCAGCHGIDGKGVHGAYPNLTKPKLLGISN
jgi:cytochrome c553